jgi:hypothetical protein
MDTPPVVVCECAACEAERGPAVTDARPFIPEHLQKLAEAQAEVLRLRTELAFAHRRIDRLRMLAARLRYELSGRRWGSTG